MGSPRCRYGGGAAPEVVTLVIPQFLQNALGCFSSKPEDDISHLHKICLVSSMQESLYVNNEQDLKDALRQYCLYKQLCEKVDGEMKKLHLEFQLSQNSIRLVKAAQAAKAEEYGEEYGGFPGATFNVVPDAYETDQDGGRPHTVPQASMAMSGYRGVAMRPASAPMRQRLRQEPYYYRDDAGDSGCCTIL